MTYEPQQSIATTTENPEISTEAYHQILPGMSYRLYPTLIVDSSLDAHVPDQQDTLQMQLTTEVNKYLQEAAVKQEMDVNYFDGQHMATNTINHQLIVDSAELRKDDIPKLVNNDTIPYIQGDSEDEQFNTAIVDTSDDLMIVMGKPLTTAFVSANVCVPTEKVGCLQVTNQLREFLIHFPPESKEKAFKQMYRILQVLNTYLIDNPQQHTHCMSPDNEYVSLIIYTTTIRIDLCNFPAIWAVLSILLDTQSNTL